MAPKRAASAPLAICSSELLPPHKKQRLHIIIPSPEAVEVVLQAEEDPLSFLSTSSESPDSLFDDDEPGLVPAEAPQMALRKLPPGAIKGVFFDPFLLLPAELATKVFDFCQKTYFQAPGANQVMLFGRFPNPDLPSSFKSSAGFPHLLVTLLDALESILRPSLPQDAFDLLFPQTPTHARQAIINLYPPGEGITPHIDLLGRYADGIIGVSFGSGCVMRFDEVDAPTSCQEGEAEQTLRRYDLFLPERSILALSKDARYCWTHGIEKKTRDLVKEGYNVTQAEGVWIERGTRISVTFRWMLEGADIVGD